MAKLTGFIITAGHLDIEWYQPLRSFRFWTVEALEDLKIAAERQDFVSYVLDGQVFPLEEYLEVVPEDEGVMRELIRRGKLAIGPFYTQFDEWLPSAESMIRNILWGKRLGQAYGGWMRAGYLPDNFGHPRQLPQILQNFGIDSLMFMRGMPEVPGGHPDEFLYEGIDGTRVLASHFRKSYSYGFDLFSKRHDPHQHREVPYYPHYMSFEMSRELAKHESIDALAATLIQRTHSMADKYPSAIIPIISGHDHFPPQINAGETVKAANQMQDDIEFIMGTAEDYVELVKKHMLKPQVYDMELIGSAYQHILLGALSTRSYLKRQNFGCEVLLERYAEPLVAYASLYGYREKKTLMKEAWRNLLINSAHDSIHGSSTDEVHTEMEARFGASRQIAAGLIADVMQFFSRRARRWWTPGSRGVLAYAPVDAGFYQSAELWLPIGDLDIVIRDEAGKALPTQILARDPIEVNGIGLARNDAFPHSLSRKVLFMDEMLSGRMLSYETAERTKAPEAAILGGEDYLENEHLRVTLKNGLMDLHDKHTGKTFYNLNLLEEEADAGDAWDFSPPWIQGEVVRSSELDFRCALTELGEVRGVLTLDGVMSVPYRLEGDRRSRERRDMPVTFEIFLYRGARRVDVRLTLHNTAKDHRVRLRVPSGVRTQTVLSQGHLAVLERPVDRQREQEEHWIQPPTQLLPCREWIAAADDRVGLAIALKGLYDYEAVMNPMNSEPDLSVTLVRGVELMGRINMLNRKYAASDACVTPGAQCTGEQVIEWAYAPYSVDPEDKAPFLKTVQSYLYPPVAYMVRSEPADEPPIAFDRLLHWEKNNIQFSAFKKCYDGDGYVLRVFENQGRRTEMTMGVGPFAQAWLSNMDEATLEPLAIDGGRVSLTIEPYKAVTVKLR